MIIKMLKRFLFASGVIIGLSGCAQSSNNLSADQEINADLDIVNPDDPFEPFNRVMWGFNYDYLDPYIMRPVSLFYANVVPSFARTGISNFIENLNEPSSVLNSLFMQEGEAALTHFNRFWINSTFGIGGILDIASEADIQNINNRQFGDVLGYYGVPQGPYFMFPGYGPWLLREGVGDFVDGVYAPLSWLTFPQSFLKWLFDGMESRAALVQQESVLKNSPDPYAFSRDIYLQHKAFMASGDKGVDDSSEEELFDDEFSDEIDNY